MQEGSRANRRSRGFSLIELLIVTAIILIRIGIAAPMYDKLEMGARKPDAIGDLRTLNTVQQQYKNTYQRSAANLPELGPPASGGTTRPQASGLLSKDITTGEAHGYLFTLTSSNPDTYTINANPNVPNSTGRRCFYTDQTIAIHQKDSTNNHDPADANSPQGK